MSEAAKVCVRPDLGGFWGRRRTGTHCLFPGLLSVQGIGVVGDCQCGISRSVVAGRIGAVVGKEDMMSRKSRKSRSRDRAVAAVRVCHPAGKAGVNPDLLMPVCDGGAPAVRGCVGRSGLQFDMAAIGRKPVIDPFVHEDRGCADA